MSPRSRLPLSNEAALGRSRRGRRAPPAPGVPFALTRHKAVILSLAYTSSSVAGALVGRVKRVREIFPIRKAYYLLQSGFLAANIT